MPYPGAGKVVISLTNARRGEGDERAWNWRSHKRLTDLELKYEHRRTQHSFNLTFLQSCTFAMISFLLDLALSVTFNLHKTFFSKRKVMLSGGPSRGISSQPSSETDSLKRIALSEFYWFAVSCTRKASDLFRWVPSNSREIDKKNECHRFYILHLEIS